MNDATPALEITDLNVHFSTPRGIARVVQGVNLSVARGSVHGLVGESGSGKSVTARTVLGIIPRRALTLKTGSIRLAGDEILDYSEDELRDKVRGKQASMVFQDPMTALNPVMRIGKQITTQIRRHDKSMSQKAAMAHAGELLDQVGLPQPTEKLRVYPHELSGGQRQRVMIALALSCDPEFIIADEPTTALDVTVQAQILDLFDKLREERNLSMLLVSHDLSLIAERCDEVSVMYAGRIVESGPAREIFESPRHPYTRMLEDARPSLENPPHTLLRTIPGRPPQLTDLPGGCSFAPRCPLATQICVQKRPDRAPAGLHRSVACHHSDAVDRLTLDLRQGGAA